MTSDGHVAMSPLQAKNGTIEKRQVLKKRQKKSNLEQQMLPKYRII